MKNFFKWVWALLTSDSSGKVSLPAPIEKPAEIETPTPVIVPSTNIRIKDTMNDGNPKAPDWNFLWDNCVLDKKAEVMLARAVSIFIANRNKYIAVQEKTGVSDWFIAGLHMREASFDFNGCLHNGDPWNKKTKNVPKGRGPWSSWSEAAIDALAYDGITATKTKTIAQCLEYAFRFNGIGYRSKIGDQGVIEYSPYVTAYTNWHDETSKYTSDGKYDPNAPEKQLSVMAFWKELENRGLIKIEYV